MSSTKFFHLKQLLGANVYSLPPHLQSVESVLEQIANDRIPA